MSDNLSEIVAAFLSALPEHAASLSLEHNKHKDYYTTAAKEIENNPDYYDDESFPDGERERCIATDELWTLHWYPRTPVGFNVIHASTLEALMAAVAEHEADK